MVFQRSFDARWRDFLSTRSPVDFALASGALARLSPLVWRGWTDVWTDLGRGTRRTTGEKRVSGAGTYVSDRPG